MAAGLHISISAEKILQIGSFEVTNSILLSLFSSLILIILAVLVKKSISRSTSAFKAPKGIQNIFEMIVEGLLNLTQDVTGSEALTKSIFPLAASFFLWILVNNWIGLLPGVGTIGLTHEPENISIPAEAHALEPVLYAEPLDHEVNELSDVDMETAVDESDAEESSHETPSFTPLLRAGTADLNTTIALALIAVTATQIIGIKKLGLSYFKKFINFSGPIQAFVGILEIVSEFSKIISFAFRLFGNIFAGEVLLAVIAFISPVFMKPFSTIPFLFLELFVAVIQALVFSMLTIVFMTMATF